MADDSRTRIVQAIIRAKNESAAVLGQFRGSLLAITATAAAVAGAMYGLQKAISSAVQAASEQENADVKLAQALSTVGQNTQAVRDDLDSFVKGLQDSTKFTDVEVQSVLSLLASLGRLSGEGLKEATRLTLDFATATEQDATSAARLLAKAALGSTQAFTRYGLVIEEGASKSEKFAAVMRFLGERQGAAEAAGKTFSAQMQNVGEQIGELSETLGTVIIQDEGFRAAIARMTVAIKSFSGEAEKGGGPVVFIAKSVGVLGFVLFQTAAAVAKLGSFLAALAVQIARILPGIDASNTKGLIQGFKGFSEGVDKAKEELTAILAEMLAFSGKGPAVADTLGKTGKGFRDLGENTETAKTALEELGFKTFAQLQEQARQVQGALANLRTAFAKGAISPEFFQQTTEELQEMARALRDAGINSFIPFELGKEKIEDVNESISLTTSEIKRLGDEILAQFQDAITPTLIDTNEAINILVEQGVAGLNDAIRESNLQVETLGATIQTTLMGAGVGGALAFGDAMVDAAFGAEVSFQELFKALLRDLAKAIVRALILQTILGVATGGGSLAAQAAAGQSFAGAPGWDVGQHGGEVRGGIPGLDSVRALLTPGEIVLPASRADQFEDMAAVGRLIRGSGTGPASPGPAFNAAFQIVPRLDDREAAGMIDAINKLVERKGYKLAASHLL